MPGSRAKAAAGVSRTVAPFAVVRIRPVPVTAAALRVVLTNGTRLEVPGRDSEALRLVMESVLRQKGATCGVSGHPKTGHTGHPRNCQGIVNPG